MRTTKSTNGPTRRQVGVATTSTSKVAVGVLVGFLGIASVAAAAVGVTAQRNNKDALVIAASEHGKKDMTPLGVVFAKSATDLPNPSAFIVATSSEHSLLVLDVQMKGENDGLLQKLPLGIRITKNAVGVKKSNGNLPACGMHDFRLVDAEGTQVGDVVAAPGPKGEVVFSGLEHAVPAGEVVTLTLKGSPSVTPAEKIHGCTFIAGLSPKLAEVVDTTTAEIVKSGGTDVIGAQITLYAALPLFSWASDTPSGATMMGEQKIIGKLVVSNPLNAGNDVVELKKIPIKISTMFKPLPGRYVRVYKDSVSPANLLYSVAPKSWGPGTNGLYGNVINAVLKSVDATMPVVIESDTNKILIITMDTQDAKPNTQLSVTIPDFSRVVWTFKGYAQKGVSPALQQKLDWKILLY